MLEWHPDGPDRRTTVAKRDGHMFLVQRYKGKYRAMVSGVASAPWGTVHRDGFRTRRDAQAACETWQSEA